MIIKTAVGWADGLLAVGKHLMTNKVVRNAAIGAGAGALAGGVSAESGNRMQGVLKGGLIGGAAGGIGTIGRGAYLSSKAIPSQSIATSIGNELKGVQSTLKGVPAIYRTPVGAAPAVHTPTPVPTPVPTAVPTPVPTAAARADGRTILPSPGLAPRQVTDESYHAMTGRNYRTKPYSSFMR